MRLRIALGLLALFAACKKTTNARTPVVTAIEPPVVCNVSDAVITVRGQNFDPFVESSLTTAPNVRVPEVTISGDPGTTELTSEFWIDNGTMQATVPAGTAAGIYDVTVTNQLCTNDKPPVCQAGTGSQLLEVKSPGDGATPTGVDPQFGYNQEDTPIRIDGSNFEIGSQVFLVTADDEEIKLGRVAYIDDNTLTALVPKGLPIGKYGLRVLDRANPCPATLMDAFEVTDIPVPRVVFVTDDFFTTQQTIVTIACGEHLSAATTTAELIHQATAATTSLTVTDGPSGVCPTGFQALQVDSGTVLGSGQYELRLEATQVTPSGTTLFSNFFVVSVVAPSANLSTVTTSAVTLTTARRGLAAVVARNDLGQRFLYAIGGDTAANDGEGTADTATAAPHNTTELAAVTYDPVNKVYDLATFRQNRTTMPEGRFLASAVAVESPNKRYIYVFGGSNGTTAAATVLRALILSERQTPVLEDTLSAAAGGTIPAGPYTYMVSAVMPPSDADNPDGETLPSDEASIIIGDASSVTLQFLPVTGAVKYRIYRTPPPPDADAGISQRERLVGEVDASVACAASPCTYTDNEAGAGGVGQLVHGSLGVWKDVTPANLGGGTTALWGSRADLYRTTAAGGFGLIYLTGGTPDGATGDDQILRFPVDNDLQLGTPDNSLTLPAPNYLHGTALLTDVGGTDYFYPLYGRLDTHYHYSAIAANGDLSFTTVMTTQLPLAGGGVLGFGAKIFWFAGINTASGVIETTNNDGEANDSGGSPGSLKNFNNAGPGLSFSRFLPGAVRVGPYSFIVGGYGCQVSACTNGTLTSIERGAFN